MTKELLIPFQHQEVKTFCLSIEDNYSHEVKFFFNWLDYRDLNFSFASLKKYALSMYDDENIETSVYNKRIAAMRKRVRQVFQAECDVTKLYHIERLLKEIPFRPKDKKPVDKDKILSREEVKILIEALPADISLITKALYLSGARIGEVLAITFKHVKVYQDTVKIITLGKRKHRNIIEIHPKTYTDIMNYFHRGESLDPKDHNDKELLFKKPDGTAYKRTHITTKISRTAKKVLNRDSIGSHTLRHSFATRKLEETGKIKAVAEALNHVDVSTTLQMYCQEVLTSEERYKGEEDLI